MNHGVCTPTKHFFECPLNSFFNGFSCTCYPGFFPIRPNSCDKCPSGTHWNGSGCSNTGLKCAPGFKWNFQTLECEPFNPKCG